MNNPNNKNKMFKLDNKEIDQEINYKKDSRFKIIYDSIQLGEVSTAETRRTREYK